VAAAPRQRRPAKRPLLNFTMFFCFLGGDLGRVTRVCAR
jgi:hypothetical protein